MNRRQALSTLTLATGAAFVTGSCNVAGEKDSSKKKKFYYSLNTSTISGNSPGIEKYIEIAAGAGYDYIEVWVRDIQAYIDGGKTLSSLDGFIKDHGIKVASAIGFAPWMTGGTQGFDQMKSEMEMLNKIGCYRVAAPPAGVDGSMPLDLFMAGEKFAELLDLGRQTGVMPQLEFWGASNSLWHLGQVLMIAAVANDPDVKILPDIYHLFRGGSGFDALKMLSGSMIDLFHMNDYPGDIPREEQVDADRVYPGEGVAPVDKVIDMLNNMEGDKILSLELFNKQYWEQDELEVAKTGLNKMRQIVERVMQ